MRPRFFVALRPDELIYSALGRQTVLLGSPGPKALMAELYGNPSAIATPDLPNRISDLLARSGGMNGLTCAELVARHTLFPYYTAFQPQEVRDRAFAAMLGAAGSVHLMLGLNTFRTGTPDWLQFCPLCLESMTSTWGSCHWARTHQLPGVVVCPEHGSRLRRSTVRLTATNRHEFVPASLKRCSSKSFPITGQMDEQTKRLALEMARASRDLLDETPAMDRAALRDYYQDELRRVGLMRGRFKVNQAELARRFMRHWGSLLPRLSGTGISTHGQTWLSSLVRTSNGAQPPLQHLLLRLFLAAQPTAPVRALRPYVERRRPFAPKRRRSTSSPRTADWNTIDADYAQRLKAGALLIRTTLPPRRVTLASVEALMGRRDWLAKRRSKLPKSQQTATEIKESIEAFRLRRLRWHVVTWAETGMVDPWQVLRRAGLNGSHIDLVRNEMDTLLRFASYPTPSKTN